MFKLQNYSKYPFLAKIKRRKKVHHTYFIKGRTKGRKMKGDVGKWRDLEGEHRKLRMKRDVFSLTGLIREALLFINEN